jgi:formylglycine-generating enzyme required for sulfatase activity
MRFVLAAVVGLCVGCTSLLADEPRKPTEVTEGWHGVTFVQIPAGEFMMGSDETAAELAKAGNKLPEGVSVDDEGPKHQVKISAFQMGKYELTRGQFRIFVEATGYKTDAEKPSRSGVGVNRQSQKFERSSIYNWTNAGFPQTDNHPVVNVSWNDAVAYCRWVTEEYSNRGQKSVCRLPTEAEWEYACRAGSTTRYAMGDTPRSVNGFGNVMDASFEAEFTNWDFVNESPFSFNDGAAFTSAAGKYKPNAFGLYDMHGNVYEWCSDWSDENYYARAPTTDPKGPDSGSFRVLRGGSWCNDPLFVRCAHRDGLNPDYRGTEIGIRVVLE